MMRKNFTHFLTIVLLCVGINMVQAQTVVWPTADTSTIRASQFANANQIFQITKTAVAPPAGFTGWVSKPISCGDPAKLDSSQWVWTTNTTSRGAYGGNRGMVAPTAANGSAFYDSDYYDNRGSDAAAAVGSGQAPAAQTTELISPTMNLTGSNDIIVEFHQLFRRFSATMSKLQYSTDGGTTWSRDYEFNPQGEIPVNSGTPNPVLATSTDSTKKRVPLVGVSGTANFKIKFIFVANYYYWAIDDVKILNGKYYDMRVDPFYAIPPSLYTPKEQLDTIRFLADVRNVGTNAMNNVKLQVKVWRDADKALVFSSTSSQYPTSFKADTAYENRILPDKMPPSAMSQVGKYFGSYRVLGDSSIRDLNPSNDTIRFEFWVSDTAAANSIVVAGIGNSNYAKENTSISVTRVSDAFWTGTEPRSSRYGNYFRINSAPATVTTLSARLNPIPARGRRVQASIYEWADADKDGVIQATERTLVAAADSLIPRTLPAFTGGFNQWMRFNLTDITTNKFFYPKAKTDYIAVIEYDAPAIAAPVDSNYLRMVFSNNSYPYNAMQYVTDSVGAPRYGFVYGKSAESDWFPSGFGSSPALIPNVRLNVLPFRLSSTPTLLAGNNKIMLSPNPVGREGLVNIDVELEGGSAALLRVLAIDGRLMAEQVLDRFEKKNIRLETNDYPSGTYLVQILTQDGIMTKKFVKAE
jgi:hypothetical protein